MKNALFINKDGQVRFCILSYLAEKSSSGDTVDGIQWWLLDRWLKHMVPKIQAVLDELISEGLVLEYKAGDLQIHYRINHEKNAEIQAFLDETS